MIISNLGFLSSGDVILGDDEWAYVEIDQDLTGDFDLEFILPTWSNEADSLFGVIFIENDPTPFGTTNIEPTDVVGVGELGQRYTGTTNSASRINNIFGTRGSDPIAADTVNLKRVGSELQYLQNSVIKVDKTVSSVLTLKCYIMIRGTDIVLSNATLDGTAIDTIGYASQLGVTTTSTTITKTQ